MDTIDGNKFEVYSPYKSKCSDCKHFDLSIFSCKAFPEGIPDRFLSGDEVHDTPTDNQVGSIVFTKY